MRVCASAKVCICGLREGFVPFRQVVLCSVVVRLCLFCICDFSSGYLHLEVGNTQTVSRMYIQVSGVLERN